MIQRTLENVQWLDKKYEELFTELVKTIKSSEEYFTVFIGAGLSIGIYPDWDKLLKDICEKMKVSVGADETTNHPDVFQKCKDTNVDIFYSNLDAIFDPSGKIDFNPSHQYTLSINFPGSFITTNIDTCLLKAAKTLEKHPINRPYIYPDDLSTLDFHKRNLYYIHGICRKENNASRIRDTVLTKTDYNNAYSANGEVGLFLSRIFKESNVMFIGFSMNDPDIQKLLSITKENRIQLEQKLSEHGIPLSTRKSSKFIFLPARYITDGDTNITERDTDKERREEEEFLSQYDIKVIRYSVSQASQKHEELEKMLNNLIVLTAISNIGGQNDQIL